MNAYDYLNYFSIFYLIFTFASILEKVSAYRFAMRYEEVSRSRETKREVKEMRDRISKDFFLSFVWPYETWKLYKQAK